MMMRRQKIILIALMILVVFRLKPSIGARLLENGLFISPENPWALDPKLNSVVQGTGSDPFKDPNEKNRLPCGEPGTLAFRLKESGIVDDKMKEASKSEEVVLNVLAKGSVTPSGGNNGMSSAQRLAKSKHSPEVGHLQIFNTQQSRVSDIRHQQRESNKRILKSTPSPGAGH